MRTTSKPTKAKKMDARFNTAEFHGDEVLVLRDSTFRVMNEGASMEIGPAFGTHHFTEGKEDSEVKTPGAMTVYLTDYTPFDRTIHIRP